MIKQFDNIKLSVAESESKLYETVCKKFGRKVSGFRILKKSLDAR